ncbi:hypothetical protein LguiA_026580 [Lonicera macranthoides]
MESCCLARKLKFFEFYLYREIFAVITQWIKETCICWGQQIICVYVVWWGEVIHVWVLEDYVRWDWDRRYKINLNWDLKRFLFEVPGRPRISTRGRLIKGLKLDKGTTIKLIAEQPQLSFLPPTHPYFKTQNGLESVNAGPENSIPTIDFALLTMGTPDQRSKVIHDLGKACEEWGFFLDALEG